MSVSLERVADSKDSGIAMAFKRGSVSDAATAVRGRVSGSGIRHCINSCKHFWSHISGRISDTYLVT